MQISVTRAHHLDRKQLVLAEEARFFVADFVVGLHFRCCAELLMFVQSSHWSHVSEPAEKYCDQ